MGQPIDFDGRNWELGKPANWTEEQQCLTLPVKYGIDTDAKVPALVSCWQLSKEELEEVQRTGLVFLKVCGNGQPPVNISGFEQELDTTEMEKFLEQVRKENES